MFRLIIFLIAAYFIYRLFANDFFRKKREEEKTIKEDRDKKIACGEMVQDPECGTYVEIDSAISVRDGARQYYFCSYECRDKFLARLGNGRNVLENDDRKN